MSRIPTGWGKKQNTETAALVITSSFEGHDAKQVSALFLDAMINELDFWYSNLDYMLPQQLKERISYWETVKSQIINSDK